MPAIALKIITETLPSTVFAEICDLVLERLIEISPVDTGLFQSNWEMIYSFPSCRFVNDTPYASYLENGHSSQAPDGMIELAADYYLELAEDYQ